MATPATPSQTPDIELSGDSNPTSTVEVVEQIFESIFADAMKDIREPLVVLKENKCNLVWSDESELHVKTMKFSKKFLNVATKKFRSKHAEASKHVEGSTCDEFQKYVFDKLGDSLLGTDSIFECSLLETKEEFSRKILKIKESLETEKEKEPKPKSDIEEMILNTDLFDPVHIHHALLCCRVAYDCKDPEHPEKSLEDLNEKHLLGELVVSYENASVPRYVMARCGDVLYVTFRGLQLSKCGSTEADWRGQVCSGIIKEARKIPLGYFAREIYQNRRIIFSGHSTGGTIAALVVIFLLEKFKYIPQDYMKSNLKCITFGLVPVGDRSLSSYVESMAAVQECFCHIVTKDDIIPKLFGGNMGRVQDLLLNLVDTIVQIPLDILRHTTNSPELTTLISLWDKVVKFASQSGVKEYMLPTFDIFGMYYILDSSSRSQKCRDLNASQARDILSLDEKTLLNMRTDHLVNHRIERYDHEVRVCLIDELPELLVKNCACSTKKPEDIAPKISEVQFEDIGKQVVAKISGSCMWFVYEVSIGDDKHLPVDYSKSTESEVQTRMPSSHFTHSNSVTVRAKTHFEDSRYMQPENVPAKTTTYEVSRRQEQLAKHSPRGVIELAYLSALLERRDDERKSKRYKATKTFFKDAVSVVPIESLFHAMATATPHTVEQCCEIFLSGTTLPSPDEPSEFLVNGMERAISHIGHISGKRERDQPPECLVNGMEQAISGIHEIEMDLERVALEYRVMKIRSDLLYDFDAIWCADFDQLVDDFNQMYCAEVGYHPTPEERWTTREQTGLFQEAVFRMEIFLNGAHESLKSVNAKSLCDINLEAIYPSSNTKDESKLNSRCHKAPMTLLINGQEKLNKFSEEMNDQQEKNGAESAASNANDEMLKVFNGLREDFKTCGTLLGAFMEARVRVPLESKGKSYVTIAKHAKSFGLGVWDLLILPFPDLRHLLNRLPAGCQRLIVDLTSSAYALHDRLFYDERNCINYDQKLEFLLTSMKKSSTSNNDFVSYSLERQLVEQCEKRHITHKTALDDIVQQWQENFEDETLTLVADRYRPLVARWIKWSLMINRLRESMAEQTAVGVIGLVNSGKSKFVRSVFGIETITGTTAQKRTTVPFIYNLEPEIKGLDIIDFPGVDDQDKTIPELAKLLLSLTRIVVFVVDYKRAHTQATKDWLEILEKENVPVLICLSFADKLYAELMGEGGNRDVKEVKADIEKQFNGIKDQIGQPETGRREFKFTVFAFDNDSKLNCDEGKKKLRQAGLHDELDVGGWIAEKLDDNQQSDLSQAVFKFIQQKEKSTLNFNKEKSKQTTVDKEH